MSEFNRFDFEQKLMTCWGITEQLDMITKGALEYDWSPDQVSNATIGLKELYNAHFNELFDMFERGVRDRKIT